MTATQAPTPGPLTSESVKLLVKGDLLRVLRKCEDGPEPGSSVTFERADGNRIWINGDSDSWWFDRFAFIGRPDADGWMPWSGGENPVDYRQDVEITYRGGRIVRCAAGTQDWTWLNEEGDDNDDIIAFRLAPPAPVEASGSERKTVANLIKENVSGPSFRDDDLVAAQAQDRLLAADKIIAYLRPQPSGETQGFTPVVGLWKDQRLSRLERVKAHRSEFGSELKQAVEAVDEEAARQALASKTTPARAKAQDEGAADALKPLFAAVDLADEYNKSDRPKRTAKDFLLDSELRAAVAYFRAHPSPTPAAVCDACGDKGYVEHEGDAWWKSVIGKGAHIPSGEVPSVKNLHPAMVKPIYDAHKGTAVADVIAGLIFHLTVAFNRAEFLTEAPFIAQDGGIAFDEQVREWALIGLYLVEGRTTTDDENGIKIEWSLGDKEALVADAEGWALEDARDEYDRIFAQHDPTPAADADRVRIAVEALEPFARLELPKKSVGNAGAYSLLHTDIRRAAEALAALKSEGK